MIANLHIISLEFEFIEDEHWNILIIECTSLSAEWEKVSGYLGLSFSLIDSIKRDHPNDSTGCWNEAVKRWIQQKYNTKSFGKPSWRTLLKAVVQVDKRLFQSLAVKHQSKLIVCRVTVAVAIDFLLYTS